MTLSRQASDLPPVARLTSTVKLDALATCQGCDWTADTANALTAARARSSSPPRKPAPGR